MKRTFIPLLLSFAFTACSEGSAEPEQEVKKEPVAETKPDIKPLADTAARYIYLTFDDGPLEGSEDIDDAVTKENIKINVFVVGQHALRSKRMKGYYQLYLNNPLIEIGNHSYSHAHNEYEKFYENPQSVLQDFLKCQDQLKIPNRYARQPGRNQWRLRDTVINDVRSGSLSADLLYKNGFKVFGWDIEWRHDSKTGVPIQTVDDMLELIEKKLTEKKTARPGHLVLLSHDEMFRNGWEESELKQLIEKIKAKGNYHLEHLSKYPE
ncbi:MAG: polysaccharide deacetylase family protein [Bacteroidetes bacterium]|nr:polysaccharide deacetylase family protein [Bacteroidota bacterium]